MAFAFLLVISLLWMAPEHSAKGLSGVLKGKKVVICLIEKIRLISLLRHEVRCCSPWVQCQSVNNMYCYGWNACVPPKFLCWNFTPTIWWYQQMGPLTGIRWGHVSGTLMVGSAPLSEWQQSSPLLAATYRHDEKSAVWNSEESRRQSPTMPAPWSQVSSLQQCKK